MDSSTQDDADFDGLTYREGEESTSQPTLPIIHSRYTLWETEGYSKLIQNPTSVLNDGLYRLLEWLPGHPFLWSLLLGFGLLLPNLFFDESASTIAHVRTYTEIHASYFFLPVLLVQILVMPVFYQAILKCFDSLRYAMKPSDADLEQRWQALVNPSKDMQLKLLGIIFAVCFFTEEYSSTRFTRFANGDWNSYDI